MCLSADIAAAIWRMQATLPQGFANVPLFFQWVVFDPTVPPGVAMSQAGKTLIY